MSCISGNCLGTGLDQWGANWKTSEHSDSLQCPTISAHSHLPARALTVEMKCVRSDQVGALLLSMKHNHWNVLLYYKVICSNHRKLSLLFVCCFLGGFFFLWGGGGVGGGEFINHDEMLRTGWTYPFHPPALRQTCRILGTGRGTHRHTGCQLSSHS